MLDIGYFLTLYSEIGGVLMATSVTRGSRASGSVTLSEGGWTLPALLVELAAGDDELIADLIATFNADAADRIHKIRRALADSDFSEIRAQAHTIKGSARQVGADAVADACQDLETISQREDPVLVAAQLNRLVEVLEVAGRAMVSYSSGCRVHPSFGP
jgi:HPt (histidine-containing phosphotransfer) domain-containing protein